MDKETQESIKRSINQLEYACLTLMVIRWDDKAFTLVQREKLNNACQIVVEVYKQFDQSNNLNDLGLF